LTSPLKSAILQKTAMKSEAIIMEEYSESHPTEAQKAVDSYLLSKYNPDIFSRYTNDYRVFLLSGSSWVVLF